MKIRFLLAIASCSLLGALLSSCAGESVQQNSADRAAEVAASVRRGETTVPSGTVAPFDAQEQAYIDAVVKANVVTPDEYADLVAAATEWCTRKDPEPGPANGTLHDQIEARYPVAARANPEYPLDSWSMLAQEFLCP